MNATLTLLGIGLFLIASLVYLFFRQAMEADEVSRPLDGNSALPSRQVADHRREQLERIFGHEDWDFIRSSSSEQVQRLFLRERKVIALAWINELGRQARAGMDFHVASVRASEELEPVVEIRMAVSYYACLAKCRVIAAIVWLVGPMAVRGMVGQVGRLSDNLTGLLDAALKSKAFSQRTGIR